MDLWTLLIGLLVIIIGIGAYVWQLSNVFFNPNQWLSPTDKTILITGCDSGIGHQLAKHFYRKGCIVFATVLDINSKGAKHLSQLSSDDQRLHLIQMNVTNDCDINQAFIQINEYLKQNHIKGLYAVINNSAVLVMGEFDWMSWNQIQSQIDVNLLGTIRVTKTFLPLIIGSKGRIINVSSVTGRLAFPGIGVYCATKYAIEGLSDALRLELTKFGVKVIVVRLGDYARLTNLMSAHESHASEMWRSMDQKKRQLYGNYFSDYHKSVQKNNGMVCPVSFQSSDLFSVFDEAVLAVNPRVFITSAIFVYRLFLLALNYMPTALKDRVLLLIVSKMAKFDNKSVQTTVAPVLQTN